MRIGLIGCGWIAETHLESLSALGEQVACVCDPDPARLAWATGADRAPSGSATGSRCSSAGGPRPCSC